MEIIENLLKMLFIRIGSIFYNIYFFFGAEPSWTAIFKILLVAQIVFLIYTRFRPATWKWATLFATELLLMIGALAVAVGGIENDSMGVMGYGMVSAVIGLAMLIVTIFCLVSAPKDNAS